MCLFVIYRIIKPGSYFVPVFVCCRKDYKGVEMSPRWMTNDIRGVLGYQKGIYKK
jgi:hypothetical protein